MDVLSVPPGAGLASVKSAVGNWLVEFAACVRAVDYEGGMGMFAPEVVAFGTRNDVLVGLESLVDRQWKPVWGVTSGFTFDLSRLACGTSGTLAWVAAPWESKGRRPDGGAFPRRGRATFILEERDGRWLALHSHLSMNPSGSAA